MHIGSTSAAERARAMKAQNQENYNDCSARSQLGKIQDKQDGPYAGGHCQAKFQVFRRDMISEKCFMTIKLNPKSSVSDLVCDILLNMLSDSLNRRFSNVHLRDSRP